ncbi:MAG: hypothetical protein WDZ50_07135 [Woeseia sp.]
MSNPVEQIMTAVTVMAGNGQVKQRLITAYEESLRGINVDDLPAAARSLFKELRTLMERVAPLNGEGAMRATVRKMSVHDTARAARLMVELLAEAIRHSGSRQARLPLHIEERPVAVPGFLAKSH